MEKFNRNYSLTIRFDTGGSILITPPFTHEFDVFRNSFSSANVSSLRIFNLGKNTRARIVKNQYDTTNLEQITIEFKAGYGNNLSTVVKGNVTQAWSVRQGVDFITEIQAFDGGEAFVDAITNAEFPANTAQSTVVSTLASSLTQFGVQKGAIGNFSGSLSRGNSYGGNTTDALREITGGSFFIDNGIVHCLKDDECLDGEVPVISSATGLLGTPVREQTFLNFDMLFEPRLKIAQLVKLDSLTAERFNGLHKVISLHHKGIISESVCGSATTSVGVLQGSFTAVPVS